MNGSTTATPFRLSRTQKNARANPSLARIIELPEYDDDHSISTPARLSVPPPAVPQGGINRPTITTPAAASQTPAPVAAKPADRLHLLAHPIAQHVLGALRNRRTTTEQFRRHCYQLLVLLLAEATRKLTVSERATGWSHERAWMLDKPVVILSLRRGGLGLVHEMAECIPGAVTGVISLTTPDHERPEPRLHLVRAPALSEAHVILFAPVISTGLSSCLALNLLRHSGAADLTVVNLITSNAGQARILASQPNVDLWTGAVDSEWDPKLGPIPGFGDFAERIYGS